MFVANRGTQGKARGLGSRELSGNLNMDQRTVLNIEAGSGNPKFEKLYLLLTYLKIPANKIFDPDYQDEAPNRLFQGRIVHKKSR